MFVNVYERKKIKQGAWSVSHGNKKILKFHSKLHENFVRYYSTWQNILTADFITSTEWILHAFQYVFVHQADRKTAYVDLFSYFIFKNTKKDIKQDAVLGEMR